MIARTVTFVYLLIGSSSDAQTVTQSFVLQPGWNAIYLEVQPTDNRASSVFANLPFSTVWTRAERLSSVEFIQNASEELFSQPGWLAWFNPSRADAFLGNLYAVSANRAYLVEVTNNAPIAATYVRRSASTAVMSPIAASTSTVVVCGVSRLK